MTRLIIIAVVFLAAFAAASGQNPTPTIPSQMVPIDIVSVGDGAKVLRTFDLGADVLTKQVLGTFQPTHIFQVERVGSAVVALGATNLIVANDGLVVSHDIPPSRYFLRKPTDPYNYQVVLQNPAASPKQISVVGNGIFSLNMPFDEVFPQPCTVRMSNGADQYCLDGDNGRLYRNRPIGFSTVRPENSQLVYEQRGLVAARPYKDGLLMLVASRYECAQDNAVQIPDSVVFCYFSGMCPQVSFSTLLFLDGSGKVTEVTKDVSINRGATLAVIGDLVYVVESRYDEKRNWSGDFVSRISISTGKKSVYFSPEMYTSLWIN